MHWGGRVSRLLPNLLEEESNERKAISCIIHHRSLRHLPVRINRFILANTGLLVGSYKELLCWKRGA